MLVTPNYWIQERCAWGDRIRRIRYLDQDETHLYFSVGYGVRQNRLLRHVIYLEPFDWQPMNSHEVYVQAIACENCYSQQSLASEAQELRLRCEYLREKLKTVKYDSWSLRADEVLDELLAVSS